MCIAVAAFASCAPREESETSRDERFVALDLGQRSTPDLVAYYMRSFLADSSGDPFAARLVVNESGDYYVDVERLGTLDSTASNLLRSLAGPTGAVDWDAFSDFIAATYFRTRSIPARLDSLIAADRPHEDSPGWMRLDAVGVMTTQRRRIFVRERDVLAALGSFRANEDRIVYPPGTLFIAEHADEGDVTEVTVMRKTSRDDWDFFAYDEEGRLVDSTLAKPKARRVPTQCFGCHFGDKLYEPERSFPGDAPDGPYGPRRLYVPDSLRDSEVVHYFDEHRHRSDGVLGLYATILVSRLRADRRDGRLVPARERLLQTLGL